eukprot:1340261-Amorphochlora_amoeboformis.AAC.1
MASREVPPTALQLLEGEPEMLKTDCQGLDELLGGGIGLGITEVYGEASTGKTQLMMQLLVQAVLPEKCGGLGGSSCYVSTEGGRERLQGEKRGGAGKVVGVNDSISQQASTSELKVNLEDCMNKIFLRSIVSADAKAEGELLYILTREISKLLETKNLRLIIIDSICGIYRTLFETSDKMQVALRAAQQESRGHSNLRVELGHLLDDKNHANT